VHPTYRVHGLNAVYELVCKRNFDHLLEFLIFFLEFQIVPIDFTLRNLSRFSAFG